MADYIAHHGILGQKWGHKNGPPYPLDYDKHSSKEKKLNPKRVIDGESDQHKNQNRGLNDKQKKAIKIAAGVTAAALVAGYGAYKLGAFNTRSKIDSGKIAVEGILDMGLSDDVDPPTEVRKVADTLNSSKSKHNCVANAIEYAFKQKGLDIGSIGNKFDTSHIKDIFKNFEYSQIEPSINPERMLRNVEKKLLEYGNDTYGILDGQYKGTDHGHAVAWHVVDRKVNWIDGQGQLIEQDNVRSSNQMVALFTIYNRNTIGFGRLDNLEIDINNEYAKDHFEIKT